MRRKIVAGNWKLHGSRQFATELVSDIVASLPKGGVEVVILPPLPYLGELVEAFEGRAVAFGSQDVSSNEKGAYTGEVCAAMLADVGARYGLVGHSERRQYHNESSELVARKFAAAVHAGLVPVLCVGETLEQREAGQTEDVIARQLAPCWNWSARPASSMPWSPMSRSGPSVPGGPPPRSRPSRSTRSSVAKWPGSMLELPIRCPSCTAAA